MLRSTLAALSALVALVSASAADDSLRGASRIEVGGSPSDVALGGGSAWVPTGRTLVRLDGRTGRVLTRTRLPGASDDQHLAIGFGSVWVSDRDAGTVARIDLRRGKLLARIPVGGSPTGIAAGFGSVWVARAAEGRGDVLRIDPHGDRVLARSVRVGYGPGPITVGAGGVWVANTSGAGSVMRIDPRTGAVTAVVDAEEPTAVEVAKGVVWVASRRGALLRIRPGRKRAQLTIRLPSGVSGLAVEHGRFWAISSCSSCPGTAVRVDAGTGRVTRRMRVGRPPTAVAVGAGAVWIASFTGGAVLRIATDPPPARRVPSSTGTPLASFRNPRAGVAARYPAGWHVIHGRLTACSDPAQALAIASFAGSPSRRIPPRGALVYLLSSTSYHLRPHPAPFALRDAYRSEGCCTPLAGNRLAFSFSRSGVDFYASVYLGRRATVETRRAALRVLDSLRVRPRGVTIRWRRSIALGRPDAGRLVHGVELPAAGPSFATWDPVLRRSPDRSRRRYGTDRLVRTVLRTAERYHRLHPGRRLLVGDLSRPYGGAFGPKHVSHQNGLDVDVYYPRRDGRERPPDRPSQIDRPLSQELVDRFLATGADKIFVGPGTGLHGPRQIVQVLTHHDNHMHVRLQAQGRAPAPMLRWRRLVNGITGHTLRYPPGWFARVRPDGSTLVSSFRVKQLDRPPPRTPNTGAYVWLMDYGAVSWSHRVAAVRRHFRLPRRTGLEGWGDGYRLTFRMGGHVFEAFAQVGRGAGPSTRRLLLQTLDSLRLTRRAGEVANLRSLRVLGRSSEGRPIRVWRIGNPRSPRKLLVVGCIHGDECAGTAVTQQLLQLSHPIAADLWVVQNLNPDGSHAGTRLNDRGVDLNRNFSSGWHARGRRGDPEYPGPRPFSEPESRIARDLILRVRPQITIWFHQPQALVRAWGASVPAARRFARLSGLPFRRLHWLAGTAPNWQNHRLPGTSSFVVELPPGPLPLAAATRAARAVLTLAQ